MGKSPAKWFRSLLGKKPSKSSLSKSKDTLKSANEKTVSVPAKASSLDVTVDRSLVVQPASDFDERTEAVSEHGLAANLPSEAVTLSSGKEDQDDKEDTNFGSQVDPEWIRKEKAATKAQAAIRGHLARCEFRTLKGIIRLQAFIRGHLVRRQAVATLRCVQAIIKFQALVRGQRVRRSSVGIEVQNRCNLEEIVSAKYSDSSAECSAAVAEQLLHNVFACKLLASSTAAPLWLQYGPGKPNSAEVWLERWTKSQFWDSQKKNIDSKSQTKSDNFERKGETEQGKPRRSSQKLSSGNGDNGFSRAISEPEKRKRNSRKFQSQPTDLGHEQPKSEVEKVKGSRKPLDLKKQAVGRSEVDNVKPKRNMRKTSSNNEHETSGARIIGFTDKKMDVVEGVPKQSDEADLKLPSDNDHSGALLSECPDANLLSTGSNGKADDLQGTTKQLNPNDQTTNNENHNTSHRRASFPLNSENQENGVHSTRKVPSYMAPTESAMAKLRAQGSPRFSQDEFEKNVMTRRHSLPSSNNIKLTSMSPRAQKLVHAANKGVIRSDKSLTSSRDGSVSDKVFKAEWRR